MTNLHKLEASLVRTRSSRSLKLTEGRVMTTFIPDLVKASFRAATTVVAHLIFNGGRI